MSAENKNDKNQIEDNKNTNEIKNISKEEETYYEIDHKNKLEILNRLIINPEYKGRSFSIQKDDSFEDESFNKSISSRNNSTSKIYIDNNIEKLVNIFIEKLFPKCNVSGFSISKKLSLEYFKANGGKVDKYRIEKCINFINSKKQFMMYNDNVTINLEFINNIGYILMASYFLLEEYRIMDKKSLKLNIKKTIKENKQVLMDFLDHYKDKSNIDKKSKYQFWESHSRHYYIPAIFIFLINVFEKIQNMEITFEESNKVSDKEEFDFFVIFAFNIENIFLKLNCVKINLNNKRFQKGIYKKYLKEYKNKLKKASNNIKKRCLNKDCLYNVKYNFKTNILINENNNSAKVEVTTQKTKEKSIYRSKTAFDVNNYLALKSIEKNPKESKLKGIQANSDSSDSEEDEIEGGHYNSIPVFESKDNNEVENPFNFIKLILIWVNCLNKIKDLNKMDLILSNSYSEEIICFFKTEILKPDNDDTENNLFFSKLKNFHIFDLIFPKFIKLKAINIEFNSLDNSTFHSLINSLYINTSINALNLSFFSSDVTYLEQSLYKLYKLTFPNEELNMHGDVEKKMLDKFLPLYAQNLRDCFDMLRFKSLHNFGINMDIPDIIENNSKYMLLIAKFIVNVIKYIYRRDVDINPIEKVSIIITKLNLNNEYYPFINKILSNIKKNNAKNMKELNFHAQLYKAVNIKNILNISLCILNIGNCDLVTFESLVGFLTSYKFSSKSNLKKLTLSLVKSVINLTMEIFSLLFQIFNIKITNLLELNIYSNIIIRQDIEYFYLLNIFNNNWISKSVFTLNKISDEILNMKECQDRKNKIKFLVPFSVENECLSPGEKKKRLSIRKNDEIKNDEAFWILKYIFKIRYSCNEIFNRNESLSKYLTYNILSYNHFSRNMDIHHHLNEVN